MKVVKTKEISGCLFEIVRELQVDSVLSKEDILYLAKAGKLEYYPEFSKPFFKIIVANKYQMKGVQGNDTIRVMFHDHDYDEHLNHIIKHIESSYNS